MYPVRLDFNEVITRINKLMTNEHYAEALVTSMFTFEKLTKRSLRRAIVARGFSIAQADQLLENNGFGDLMTKWDVFERLHRKLPVVIGREWQHMKRARKMRNDLVHGNKVFKLDECQTMAEAVLKALKKLHTFVVNDYGVDPWKKQPRQKAELQWKT